MANTPAPLAYATPPSRRSLGSRLARPLAVAAWVVASAVVGGIVGHGVSGRMIVYSATSVLAYLPDDPGPAGATTRPAGLAAVVSHLGSLPFVRTALAAPGLPTVDLSSAEVRSRLDVRQTGAGGLILVEYEDRDPYRVAAVVQRLTVTAPQQVPALVVLESGSRPSAIRRSGLPALIGLVGGGTLGLATASLWRLSRRRRASAGL